MQNKYKFRPDSKAKLMD